MLKANPAIYQTMVANKVRNQTFASIVNECFINALPFNRLALTDEAEHNLGKYLYAVTENLGGYDALYHAYRSEPNLAKKALLYDITKLCNDTATEAALRIAGESIEVATEGLNPDSTLTKEEYSKFINKAESLDMDDIGKIVKDKVLVTIKAEKAARERNDQINTELKNAISPDTQDDDSADVPNASDRSEINADKNDDVEAFESYKAILTGSRLNNIDNHKSFYNTIMTAAVEQMMAHNDLDSINDDEIDPDRLMNITLECGLPEFNTHNIPADRALNFVRCYSAQQNITPEQNTKVLDCAMLDTIIVYTVYETLYTLNLIHPNTTDMKTAMDSRLPIIDKLNHMNQIVRNAIVSILTKPKPSLAMPKQDRQDAMEQQIKILQKLNEKVPDNKDFTQSHIQIQKAIESLTADINKMNQPKAPNNYGYFDKIATENYIAQFNKIASFAQMEAPRIDHIDIEQTSNNPVMEVHMRDAANNSIFDTHIAMENFDGGLSEMQYLAISSKLNSKELPTVYYKKMDGFGRKTPICNS